MVLIESLTTEKIEVLPAKSFILDSRLSDKSLIYIYIYIYNFYIFYIFILYFIYFIYFKYIFYVYILFYIYIYIYIYKIIDSELNPEVHQL